jgi:glucosamine 6-phosphate synthetase-like amidotransferase/phosphosugar isomerase protein
LLSRLPDTGFERIYVVGCGTSYESTLTCKYVFEEFVGVPTEAVQAYAFATYQRACLLNERTLVVAFTCGGATAAACDSLSKANDQGSFTLAVTAVPFSPITNIADGVVLTGAAGDMGAPHTKSHTRGLFSLYLTAIRLGAHYGASVADTAHRMEQVHAAIPAIVQVVDAEETWRQLAETYRDRGCDKVFVFGMGPNAGTATYSALAITELAKIYSTGHEMEDFLHGRWREVNVVNPLIVLGPDGKGTPRLLDFLAVASDIPAQTVVLTDRPHPGVLELAQKVLPMPGGLDEIFTPLVYLVPMQLFGYHLALLRGWDPASRRYSHGASPSRLKYTGQV